MSTQPPDRPTRIVITRKPAKRSKAIATPVASPTRIVFGPRRKQRDAWARYLRLTGKDE
jgi:hypothetical protein